MSMSKANIDETWAFMADGVNHIMAEDLTSQWLTTSQYMKMYTAIHNFCVAVAHTAPETVISGRSRAPAGDQPQLQGGALYHRLQSYLQEHLVALRDEASQLDGQDLISYYEKRWNRYSVGVKYLDHIFSYLNRHWVKHVRDEGPSRNRNVHEVNTLCLILWRDYLFKPLKDSIVNSLLGQIKLHRDGQQVDINSLQVVIGSLVSIGLDDHNVKRSNLLFYNSSFEDPFIEATEKYYTDESVEFLAQHGVVQYMQKVDMRFKEEHQRVAMFLNPSTESRLIEVCERVLIENHAEAIQGEFLGLLAADRQDDCHLLYRLLSKIPKGILPMQGVLKEYVRKQGMEAIDKLVEENPQPDGRAYVGALLDVYEYFENLLKKAFENSNSMVKAVASGCEDFINNNTIARKPVNGRRPKDSRTPELLAKFGDSLLKKSSKNAEYSEIEESLDGIIKILKYVDERDLFEEHYSRLLSRRLVNQNSANQDLEASMVSKLNELCGFEYTNKLQRMFQDITTSSELQQYFHTNLQKPNEPDFNPFVLAEGFWPLPYKEINVKLPDTLQPAFDRFTNHYTNIHNGRKLKWLWNFGKAEIKANFTKNKTGYIFQVSVVQMLILLAFNDHDTLSLQELQDITGLSQESIANALHFIVKARVLSMTPPTATPGDSGTSYSVNLDFKNKKVRINLNMPHKSETKTEAMQTSHQVEENRKMFLQAVCVRIMKARKELSHAQLVEETMLQARKRFAPEVRDIKQCIQQLVDKEYLQRVGTDRYIYLA